MPRRIALIGFGEAARAFAPMLGASLRAYDLKLDDPMLAPAMRAAMSADGVAACSSPAEALAGAEAVLSLVTADQALAAARAAAPSLAPDTLWLDMNSVAPGTKREAAAVIEAAGGRYVDVAVMAPVHPARTAVPLLVAGPDAGAALLRALGFTAVEALGQPVGAAAAVKMIRSVMVKGVEALTAECLLAADAAEVREAVLASLAASPPSLRWDYNLDRMRRHGARRAAEMEEVVRTLDALGTGSAMSRAAVGWQARMAA